MRLARFRFTVRRLMVVVATVAVVLGLGGMWMRRERYVGLAHAYSLQEQVARDHPGLSQVTKMDRRGKVLLNAFPDKLARYTRMRAKYEHAARYPWLHVAPDPPEPE